MKKMNKKQARIDLKSIPSIKNPALRRSDVYLVPGIGILFKR